MSWCNLKVLRLRLKVGWVVHVLKFLRLRPWRLWMRNKVLILYLRKPFVVCFCLIQRYEYFWHYQIYFQLSLVPYLELTHKCVKILLVARYYWCEVMTTTIYDLTTTSNEFRWVYCNGFGNWVKVDRFQPCLLTWYINHWCCGNDNVKIKLFYILTKCFRCEFCVDYKQDIVCAWCGLLFNGNYHIRRCYDVLGATWKCNYCDKDKW